MTRILIISICLSFGFRVMAQSSVYSQTLQTLSGEQIALSVYSGKKVLVATCSAFTPDLARLKSLDSLNSARSGTLQVIVIPVKDLDSVAVDTISVNMALMQNHHYGFIMGQPGMGKKTQSLVQIPLLRWLTNSTGNIHFNDDLQNLTQMFLIGENGVYFAEMFGLRNLYDGTVTSLLGATPPKN